METDHQTLIFLEAIVLLGAAVVAVPLFKRLGLGSVLGYLAAGIVIGPSLLGLFREPEAVMQVAELGVVLLLFVIGLELNLSRLWQMRRDIFGLGSAQIIISGLALMLYPLLVVGRPWQAALVAGLGLALSSTAFVMQMLEERGEMRRPHGQKAFAILLMQDLAIVPLLGVVAFLSPITDEGAAPLWQQIALAVGAVALVILAGRYLLNPMFRLLARAGAREIMTAAALFVVIGAASLMALVGLSMALGAFLAGILLAESNYRHELEADIEPFRGILLGLFFMSVGMSVDLGVVLANALPLLAALCSLVTLKALILYGLARAFGSDHNTAVRTGLILAQGGEFGFVLFSTAVAAGVMQQEHSSLLIALVTLSMATTPFLVRLGPRLLCREEKPVPEGADDFSDADGEALVVGFGRFGQLATQVLLAGNVPVTIIDSDPERIEEAGRFGTRVYYGDGTRLDVLRAAGIERVGLVVLCADDREAQAHMVELIKSEYPDTSVVARAYDRRHALDLLSKGVDAQVRETFGSALSLGREALVALGIDRDEAVAIEGEVRRRDMQRLQDQLTGGLYAGRDKYLVRPEPLTRPSSTAKAAE